MSDDWELPVPRIDPEARKAPAEGGASGGCPMTPGMNFVEGGMDEEGDVRGPERAPVPGGN